MNCYTPLTIKVYLLTGILYIDFVNGKLIRGNPSLFIDEYKKFNDNFPENDRVSLLYQGRGFDNIYPSQIQKQDGTQVGNISAIMEYFTSLGIGAPQSGTTPTNNQLPYTLPFILS